MPIPENELSTEILKRWKMFADYYFWLKLPLIQLQLNYLII